MLYKNFLLIILGLFLCISCNLRPIYNNKYNVQELDNLSSIEVEPIDSVEGAELVYHLSSILPKIKGVKAKYLLKINFTTSRNPSILQKNSDVLREMINQTFHYKLIDILTNKEVTDGKFYHTASYHVGSSPYGSSTLGEVELKEATKHAAEEVIHRLIIYFKAENR